MSFDAWSLFALFLLLSAAEFRRAMAVCFVIYDGRLRGAAIRGG